MGKKKRLKKLKKVINSNVVIALERMKTISPEDRFALFLEVGEWMVNVLDAEDELMVPRRFDGSENVA